MINYQSNTNQYIQKWKNVPSDHELRLLRNFYQDLMTRHTPIYNKNQQRSFIFKKYTKVNQVKEKFEHNPRKELPERPKTCSEPSKILGNLFVKNNLGRSVTRPKTTGSIRSKKSLNDRKKSVLQLAKEYGNQWGRKVSQNSLKKEKLNKSSTISQNRPCVGAAELRKDYGNYYSLRNRIQVLDEFEQHFEMNYILRAEYDRTLGKMSEFESKYGTGQRDQSEPDLPKIQYKSSEIQSIKAPSEQHISGYFPSTSSVFLNIVADSSQDLTKELSKLDSELEVELEVNKTPKNSTTKIDGNETELPIFNKKNEIKEEHMTKKTFQSSSNQNIVEVPNVGPKVKKLRRFFNSY